jgi:hypothetical protein
MATSPELYATAMYAHRRSDGLLLCCGVLLCIAASLLLGGPSPARAGVGVWTIEEGLADSAIGALAIDPQVPATLYAGTVTG